MGVKKGKKTLQSSKGSSETEELKSKDLIKKNPALKSVKKQKKTAVSKPKKGRKTTDEEMRNIQENTEELNTAKPQEEMDVIPAAQTATETDRVCPVSRERIESAVQALLKVVSDPEKIKVLGQDVRVNLMITTHQISPRRGQHELITLPHPIYSLSSEICVFTKDIDKEDTEKSVEHFEDMFRRALGSTPKIIPVTSLKKDYKGYEAKRLLSKSFDLFLVDKRLVEMLPRLIGKHFYKKKKQPININMQSKDLKKEFNDLVSSTKWIVTGHGNCSMVHAAYAHFKPNHIADNLEACITAIADTVMRGWPNIKSLYIKSDDSLGIPLYLNDEASEEVKKMEGREIDYLKRKAARKDIDDVYGLTNKRMREISYQELKRMLEREDDAIESS